MTNIFFKIAMVVFGIGLCFNNSFATILVSGDVDLVYPINPDYQDIQFEGNHQFFLNILQGSRNVAVVDKQIDVSIWNPQTFDDTQHVADCNWDKETAVNGINSFYNAQDGITSSVITTVTASVLEDVGLLVVPLPGDNFSTEELSIMNGFINDGGSVFFLGESYYRSEQNTYINNALSGLGSTLSIAEYSALDGFDGGPRFATGDQIMDNAFTSGIDALIYGDVSEIKGDAGRLAPLFLTQEGSVPFIAYELPLAVPEPPALSLIFIGLPALLICIRKRK